MLRLVWILLALAVSAFLGFQWFSNGAGTIAWFLAAALNVELSTLATHNSIVAVSNALVVAALCAFLLVFVGLAISDFFKFQSITGNLERLHHMKGGHGQLDLPSFLRVFRDDDDLSRIAADYGATLHEEPAGKLGAPSVRLRAALPAASYFGSVQLVDRPLVLPIFKYLPRPLVGIGLVGLLLSLLEGVARLDGSAMTETAATVPESLLIGAQAGLTSLAVAAAAAILVGLTTRIVLEVRYQQSDRLCRIIDAMFIGPVAADYLRELTTTTTSEATNLLAAVRRGSGELKAIGDQISQSLDASGKVTAELLANAVINTLEQPMAKLTALSEQQAKDQRGEVAELLQETLAAFTTQLEASFGNQLKDVNIVLQSTTALAEGVKTSFGEASDALSERATQQAQSLAQEISKGIENGAAREAESREALAAELKGFSKSLAEEVESHSRRFEALLNNLLDRVEYLTESAVASSAADLTRAAESFTGLREVVESLVLSVTPILNQVVDSQERLVDTLQDEQAAGKLIARSAGDMNAAAKASRETVERFIVLAERLSESRGAKTGDRSSRSASMQRSEPESRQTASTDGEFTSALRQLRATAEDSTKKLPKL